MGIDLGSGALADLARVGVRYLLEWRQSGQIYRSIALPLPPRALTITQQAPALVTYTLGGQPIRELGAYRSREIKLTGSAGYDVRVGYTRDGAITSQLGSVLLREFRGFLEEYQSVSEGQSSSSTGEALNELIFRALDEDYHLRVEVVELEIQRDAMSSHFAPDWTLTLRAYDDAETQRVFEDAQKQIDDIKNTIDAMSAGVAVTQAAIDGAVGVTALLLSPMDSLNGAAKSLENLGESLRSVLALPSDVIGRAAQTALVMRTTATRIIRDVERVPSALSAKYRALRSAIIGAEEAQAAAESLGVFIPISPESDDLPSSPLYVSRGALTSSQQSTPTQSGVTVYRLRLGEDLYTLARRIFGDADRWYEIAELNGWIDPYHLPSGRPATSGDVILIPLGINNAPSLDARDVYGEDLYLSPEGDLILGDDRDLRTITATPNLEQGIRLRLLAELGETPIFDRYGLPSLLGRRISTGLAGYLGSYVREQLARDVRVDSVPVIDVIDAGDQIAIDLQIRSSESGLLSMRVTV